jgi:hypothetical protein
MRGSRARTAVAAALIGALLAWATPAAAEEDAAVHYKKGRSLYNVSEYRAALDEFKQAYVLHEDPAFLYNIAQCHRQLGNHREAITFYKRFLNESPRAPNRREIERLIGELEEKAAAAPKAPVPPVPPSEPAAPHEEPPQAAPPASAAPAPVAPPPEAAGEPRGAAGLHLELGGGVGFLHDSFDWLNLTRGTANGVSGAFQLAATYGVLPHLALGLLFGGESVQSPRVEVSGVRSNNVSVGTLGFLGVMADWRPRPGPTGWHVELALGGARMKIDDKSGIIPARAPVGGGGAIAAGHDWSIAANWQLGFLVRVMGAALTDEGTDHKIVTASAQLVVGYH